MNNKRPKHSVIIISYNQEKVIGRALDSVLCQKEFLYEIIVCDDYSTDNTWNVIKAYQIKNMGIIKPFRNEKNLGIFGNIESTWSKPSGDIIWYLAGDDEFSPELFINANQVIAKNKIDYDYGLFTIYFDWKKVDPRGKEKTYSNKLITKYNPVSLVIRHAIYNRTTGVSKGVVKKFYPVRKDIGISADGLIDIQTQLFSENNYYCPYVGSVYYTEIGIGSKTSEIDRLKSYLCLFNEYHSILKNISKKDENWIMFQKHKTMFFLNKNINNFYYYILYFIKSCEPKYGLKKIFVELFVMLTFPLKR